MHVSQLDPGLRRGGGWGGGVVLTREALGRGEVAGSGWIGLRGRWHPVRPSPLDRDEPARQNRPIREADGVWVGDVGKIRW